MNNNVINLDNIKIVLTQGKKNYEEIITSLDKTSHLYITSFNYYMPEDLEEIIMENIEFVNDIKVVFNVYNFDGNEEQKVYQLLIKALKKNPYVQFFYNRNNHSKIISNGKKLYIGSSNITENASNNFEAGVVLNDIETIKKIENRVFEYAHIKYESFLTDPISPLIIPFQFFTVESEKEFNSLEGLIDFAKRSSFFKVDDELPTDSYKSTEFLLKYYQTFLSAKKEINKYASSHKNDFLLENLFNQIDIELKKLCDFPPLGTPTKGFFEFLEDYQNTIEEYKEHFWRTQIFKADSVVIEEKLYVTHLRTILAMFYHLRKTWIKLMGVKKHFFLKTSVPITFWFEEPSMAEPYWRVFLD